jgi:arylsulfatase
MAARIAALVVVGACSHEATVEGAEPCQELRGAARVPRPSVVLVVNDTTRRDRLGAYGGPARTPAFDRFANENLRFDAAFTQAPWTRPAMASLLTGLLPSQHGVGMEQGKERSTPRAVAPEITTLAEVLQAAGYRSAAFVSNPWMETSFGFDQGFDVYDMSFARWGLVGDEEGKLPGVEISAKALAWVATLPLDMPYFLYVHYLDSHRPYPVLGAKEIEPRWQQIRSDTRALSERASREIPELVRVDGALSLLAQAPVAPNLAMLELAYDKGIEHFDMALDRLLQGLDRTEAGRRAAIVVTADHGEALFERGYGNHGRGLHDDELAIPLAMRLPGIEGPRDGVQCLAGLVDILPTLCTYLGLGCPAGLAGRDLLAPEAARRYVVSEAVGFSPRHRSIRNRDWKLIWQPDGAPDGRRANPYSLYRIADDPAEARDLIDAPDPAVRAVAEHLEAELRAAGPLLPRHASPNQPIDERMRERLRQLGYVE